MNVKTKVIEYRGEKIFFTAGFYCFSGLLFRTLSKAKTAIDNIIKERELGLN